MIMTYKEMYDVIQKGQITAGQMMAAENLGDFLLEKEIKISGDQFNEACSEIYEAWRDNDYPKDVYYVVKAYYELSDNFTKVPNKGDVIDLAWDLENEDGEM